MKRNMIGLLILLLALMVVPAHAQDEEFIFGMILVGPANDGGWSQAHYEGGRYVEENVPGATMLVFESLNPADAPEATLESVVTDMVSAGAQLIITSSDAFEQDTDTVAALFPDVVFVNVSGSNALAEKAADVYADVVPAATEDVSVTEEAMATAEAIMTAEAAEGVPANVGNLMAGMEWYKLVAGCAAALTTETGQIGYLGPLINAETRRFAASAYLGARYCYEKYRGMDPATLQFNVTWIGFWFNIPGVTLDPTEEANNFFDNGADVVISGIDTTQAVVVAGQRFAAGERVFAVAYDSVVGCDEAPAACLGVPYYNWGPAYVDLVNSVKDGSYSPSWVFVDPSFEDNSIVGYLPGEGLSEEVRTNLDAFIAEIEAYATDSANEDTVFLWDGPLNLQDGTPLVVEGESADLLEIWYLPQLLEGMNGASS
jgi:simple sugar transport system substrate-binding protein